jgi:hypothetical protein
MSPEKAVTRKVPGIRLVSDLERRIKGFDGGKPRMCDKGGVRPGLTGRAHRDQELIDPPRKVAGRRGIAIAAVPDGHGAGQRRHVDRIARGVSCEIGFVPIGVAPTLRQREGIGDGTKQQIASRRNIEAAFS